MDNQNQITLEQAIDVMAAHMEEAKALLKSAGHNYAYTSFIPDPHDGKCFYASGACNEYAWGKTAIEAAQKVPTPKTRIEKLRAELAELEKAEASKGKEAE